jgi:competence protein ComEA
VGQVLKPGVYEVSDGSRWQEVVLMASGFVSSADKKFIHQELNLAEKVKDQAKLYVPYASDSAAVQRNVAQGADVQDVLSVNTAEAKIWDEIEGIGEAKTKSIIAGAPYIDKNDFLARSGISTLLYKNIEQKYKEIIY